jgi:hypothetical protein
MQVLNEHQASELTLAILAGEARCCFCKNVCKVGRRQIWPLFCRHCKWKAWQKSLIDFRKFFEWSDDHYLQ